MLESSVEIGAEIFFGLVKKAYSGLSGYAQERDFFKTATRKYIKNLRDDFGEVRVLGMKERVPLESLYVRANVLEKLQVRSGVLPEEMEQDRAMFLSAFGNTRETIDGEKIVNMDENLIVLGKPGAGKTTYLKYLTLRMTSKDKDSSIKQRRLPIFVTLHEFAKSGKPLMDYMVEQFGLCGFENAKSFIERILSNGDCMVLLDGLDEVSRESNLDAVIQEVTDFTRRYRESRFIVSCRVAAYNLWFSKFKEVEIADFNKAQIEEFVAKYFQKEPVTGRECWKKLQTSQPLLEMASSPLLLTLLCITYDKRQDFPANRALLYGYAIKGLINKWDSERLIQRDRQIKNLDEPQLQKLFSRLAAGYFESDNYFFGEEDLCKGIGKFLANIMGNEYINKGALMLQDIEQYYGLIVRRSQFAFSFSHLTFMEYFTAMYVVDNASSGSVDGLIENHLWDNRWQEVFMLSAGKLGSSADEFLLKIQKENRKLLNIVPKLNELLGLTQKAILAKESTFTRGELELIAFYLSLNHIRPIDNLLTKTIIYTRGLDHALGYDVILELDLGYTFDFEIDHNYLDSHRKTESVSDQNLEKISDYLNGNLLLVKCLNSGATVSAKVREHVLAGLFRPEGA